MLVLSGAPAFELFGAQHRLALGLVGGISAAWLVLGRRIRRLADDQAIRVPLAAGLIAAALWSWLYFLAQGIVGLPCQLCELAIWLMAAALIGRSRLVGELGVCWGLSGSSQAILTPDLAEGWPNLHCVTFFGSHSLVVVSAVYALVRGRVRLTPGSIWRVWLVSNVYLFAAGLLNWRLGTNFGYLAAKPAHPSLLDALGPWPFYIVGMELIGLASFVACLVVNRLIERWVG